ncbi:MAG: FeoB-associated Cys-rich membrane protein [Clostridia bacterium]|nr:FeoB-associated Cys-rich membrane protein [Clostridia bacterium]
MLIDILIGVGAAAIVVGVIVLAIVRKKQGKSIGCDCSSCDGCCGCNRKKEN